MEVNLRVLPSIGRLVLALSLATLGVAAAPTVTLAQGIPGGSYVNSCNNIQLVSNVLEASCQRSDGAWVNAALANPGSCVNGVVNSNGALVCASPPAPAASTSQYANGLTVLHNNCSGNQKAYFGIATNNNETSGLVVLVSPGQTVELGVTQGSSFVNGCGSIPTDRSHFQYFAVTPLN